MADSQLNLLMKIYQVTYEDCKQQVTDIHLYELSCYPLKWESLIPNLKMDNSVIRKIECNPGDKGRKKAAILQGMELQKGTEATYREIVNTLLEIGYWNESEGICKLL